MELKPCICNLCIKDIKQPIKEIPIEPDIICNYCQKSECELLYLSKPCCQGCLKNQRMKQSFSRRRNLSSANLNGPSNSSLKSIRLTPTNLTRKIDKLIQDCRGNQKQLNLIKKNSLAYYIPNETAKITWTNFLDKLSAHNSNISNSPSTSINKSFTSSYQNSTPMTLFLAFKDRIIGAYWSIMPTSKKQSDLQCGIFDYSNLGLQFSFVSTSTLYYQNKILYFGQPHSLCFNFELGIIQCQMMNAYEQIQWPNLFLFKLN